MLLASSSAATCILLALPVKENNNLSKFMNHRTEQGTATAMAAGQKDTFPKSSMEQANGRSQSKTAGQSQTPLSSLCQPLLQRNDKYFYAAWI